MIKLNLPNLLVSSIRFLFSCRKSFKRQRIELMLRPIHIEFHRNSKELREQGPKSSKINSKSFSNTITYSNRTSKGAKQQKRPDKSFLSKWFSINMLKLQRELRSFCYKKFKKAKRNTKKLKWLNT